MQSREDLTQFSPPLHFSIEYNDDIAFGGITKQPYRRIADEGFADEFALSSIIVSGISIEWFDNWQLLIDWFGYQNKIKEFILFSQMEQLISM